jgi:hypothetical protein
MFDVFLVEIVGVLVEANPDLDGNLHLVLRVNNWDYASKIILFLKSLRKRKVVVKIKEG